MKGTRRRKAGRRKRNNSTRKRRSFSPTINEQLLSLRTASPVATVFRCKKPRHISIPSSRGKGSKCVGWKSKRARDVMLRNLLSKKPIDCSAIVAPRQILANCWFNAFFVAFFISDKGRKFFRYLRQSMITGVMPDGGLVPVGLRWPLFLLLNKCIDASIQGKTDPSGFAYLMDTNSVIKSVAMAAEKHKYSTEGWTLARPREASNPLTYYMALLALLPRRKGDRQGWIPVGLSIKQHGIDAAIREGSRDSYLIFVEVDDEERPAGLKIRPRMKVHGHTFVLDSAVLRDPTQSHFSTYLTCNGKEFAFDGESYAGLIPFQWKRRLNGKSKWVLSKKSQTIFSFATGYILLLYYRT